MIITMKKLILLYLAIFAIPVFSEVFRDERGVLFMNEEEWIKFYNRPGENDEMCLLIGSLIMEESYIKDGKQMGSSASENREIIGGINALLLENGFTDPDGGDENLHEYYYATGCKKLTEKDFEQVGSPTFKKTMNRIFKKY